MASKKKVTKPVEQPEIIENQIENQEETITNDTPAVETVEKVVEKPEKVNKKNEKEPKFKIGSIVFVSKDAEADLNGFKLFPQYKKYTYTVEAVYEPSVRFYRGGQAFRPCVVAGWFLCSVRRAECVRLHLLRPGKNKLHAV